MGPHGGAHGPRFFFWLLPPVLFYVFAKMVILKAFGASRPRHILKAALYILLLNILLLNILLVWSRRGGEWSNGRMGHMSNGRMGQMSNGSNVEWSTMSNGRMSNGRMDLLCIFYFVLSFCMYFY